MHDTVWTLYDTVWTSAGLAVLNSIENPVARSMKESVRLSQSISDRLFVSEAFMLCDPIKKYIKDASHSFIYEIKPKPPEWELYKLN